MALSNQEVVFVAEVKGVLGLVEGDRLMVETAGADNLVAVVRHFNGVENKLHLVQLRPVWEVNRLLLYLAHLIWK